MSPDDDTNPEPATNTTEPRSGPSVPADTEWEMIVQRPFGPSEDHGLTYAIVSAVAEAEGVSPRDILQPPLYEVIDPSALEAAIFGPDVQARTLETSSSTEFMYRGYRVVVQSDGWVMLYERSNQ